jgi:LCP family protein required for cell wall assembly
MAKVRPRPRSQRYRRTGPARALTLLLVLVFVGGCASLPLVRTLSFLHHTVNLNNPLRAVQNQIDPPPGSIAWKIKYGEQVNILALGYGGQENDAPWLTDTIMVISLDPATRRVTETSIPRDLYVRIDAWPGGGSITNKVNVAFEVGNLPQVWGGGPLRPEFEGKDGPGHLVESTIGKLTGLTFDRYVAVDFKAFRDVVDALGGIQVHMDGPLDDCHYPSYGGGYLNGGVALGWACPPAAGIHFQAGDYRVDGEQALELARSREAVEANQSSDFGRARRQQMIVAAIRRQASVTNALAKAPQLMDALQSEVETDMDLTDLAALHGFGAKLSESSFLHLAITDQNLVEDYGPGSAGSCGSADAFALCPDDPTYRTWQTLFSHLFVDPRTLVEHAPIELVDANPLSSDLSGRVASLLHPLGFQLTAAVQGQGRADTVVYDYSGGRYPQTAAWLEGYFGASVVEGPDPAPGPGEATAGLVVALGTDYARHWYGG